MPILLAVLLSIATSVNARVVAHSFQTGFVRVFVYTAEPTSGSADQTFAGRTDSVKDLQAALRKKSGLTIVESRERADVVVEVVGRGEDDTGEAVVVTSSSPVTGTPHTDTMEIKDAVIRLKLTAGSDVINLQGSGGGGSKWRAAAANAAKVIDQWIKDHRDKLPASSAR